MSDLTVLPLFAYVTNAEEWRPVVGYDGRYEVSNLGRVKIIGGETPAERRWIGHITLGTRHGKGYRHIWLRKDGENRIREVHQLVAEAFLGPRPPGMEPNHGNGDKGDNRLGNLEWLTESANSRHALDVLGWKPPAGEAHCHVKLTDAEIVALRERKAAGESYASISRDTGLRSSYLSDICTGVWRKGAGGPLWVPSTKR